MKKVLFKLELSFSGEVPVADLRKIMQNINNAIINEANQGMGISPDGSDYHTTAVQVDHILVEPIKENIF